MKTKQDYKIVPRREWGIIAADIMVILGWAFLAVYLYLGGMA